MDMLVEFNTRQGLTVVMVTHEPDMAAYAHRRIQFQDGRIVADSGAGR
jgi:ABC-type lipoprotein export system ATPase subunit